MRRLMFLAIVLALLLPVAAVSAQTTHTVARGQTLFSIAQRYGLTVADILAANPWIGSGNVIHAGNQLVIPVPGQPAAPPAQPGQPAPTTQEVRHTVAPGEYLSQIAQRYGVSYVDIINRNNLVNPDVLHVGTVLIIPGVTVAPPTAPPATTGEQPQPTSEVRHTVARGEYLGLIAERYDVLVADILRRNNIANPDLVYPGTVLIIPGVVAEPAPAPAPEAEAPPPAVNVPAIGGGFALGGQALSFAWPHHMHAARMTWVKRQVRYHAGDNAANVRGVIDQAHGAGFRVLLSVVGEPGQMAGNPSGYIQEFANFLGGVASLGPDAIEVWNEQNIDREWPSGQIGAQAYTSMLSQAWNAIKGANANVMVISGAPAPTGFFNGCHSGGCDDLPFIRGMAAAGAANYMDCVGIHYNEGILGPDARSGDPRGNSGHYTRYYSRMFETYASVFPGKPLCFTEIGYLSSEGYGPLPGGFAWAANVTVANQAAWLGRAVTLARSSGRVRLFIVWNVDATRYDSDPQAGFAIVRPGGDCPACGHLAAAMA